MNTNFVSEIKLIPLKGCEYKSILKNGTRRQLNGVILYSFIANNTDCAYGFSIGKKIGNAVARNKLKRQLRSIIRELADKLTEGQRIIVIIRPEQKNANYHILKQIVSELL